ncbi:FAD-dependent oxidoreductase [Parasphingorhabdus pacifica]
MNPSVLVVGAGVQGLSTGVVLAEQGYEVLIRTAERPQETTSAVAGAMWGPAMLRPPGRVLYWATMAHAEFMTLAREEDSGVRLVPGRMASRLALGDTVPPETRLLTDLRHCTEDELPEGFASGYRATVPLIDMPRYLDRLVDRFQSAGGRLVLSPVPSLAEAVEEAATVVNCSGVGARELVGDPGVHPVRGQQVVVRNPGVEEYFVEVGSNVEFASFFPHGERLVLGGIAVDQDWNPNPSERVTEGIIRRCAAIDPRVSEVEVLEVRVGLRPGRDAVRLDVEEFRGARIVHNYGHGSSGVALSWGCAFEAADLVTGEA